jgi:hypothetical protein
MFVITYLQVTLRTWYIGMFVIYLSTSFHIPMSNISLVIVNRLEAIEHSSHDYQSVFVCKFKNVNLKSCYSLSHFIYSIA